MDDKKIILNTPPAKTYGWLRVNGTPVEAPERWEEKALDLAAGEERTVVLDDDAPAARFTAELGEGAVLRLVQLRRGGAGREIRDTRVTCAAGARFEWYRVVLGGGETYDNCSVTLEGDGGYFAAEIGYSLGGEEKYDINCEVFHQGKRTESAVRAAGVLRGRACKLFRGTIDLQRGCAGSVGNETEEVLLLDESVRNRTVPVILCGEEDVVGNHGATIGRLDEDLLFYLASRGIGREAATDMMARARLESVIRRIPDEAAVRSLLGGGEEGV